MRAEWMVSHALMLAIDERVADSVVLEIGSTTAARHDRSNHTMALDVLTLRLEEAEVRACGGDTERGDAMLRRHVYAARPWWWLLAKAHYGSRKGD